MAGVRRWRRRRLAGGGLRAWQPAVRQPFARNQSCCVPCTATRSFAQPGCKRGTITGARNGTQLLPGMQHCAGSACERRAAVVAGVSGRAFKGGAVMTWEDDEKKGAVQKRMAQVYKG